MFVGLISFAVPFVENDMVVGFFTGPFPENRDNTVHVGVQGREFIFLSRFAESRSGTSACRPWNGPDMMTGKVSEYVFLYYAVIRLQPEIGFLGLFGPSRPFHRQYTHALHPAPSSAFCRKDEIPFKIS